MPPVPSSPGPLALVGSGEFLPVMAAVDAALLDGRPRRAAYLPTAAAPEGDERFDYWADLGRRHFEEMDVEPVLVPVRTRADADSDAMAGRLAEVGLVYLSGGDPHHLAATLRDTAVWQAVVDAWRAGAALAGCSAGAMALSAGAPPDLAPGGRRSIHDNGEGDGLGVAPGLAVIPHFDQMERWRPGAVSWFAGWQPPGTTLVGIDEDTALVYDDAGWRVEGRQAVWILDDGNGAVGAGRSGTGAEPDRRRYEPGSVPPLAAPHPPGIAPLGEAL
jgi:cyanophycinase